MLSRFLAIMLVLLLAVLPTAGGAMAWADAGGCEPAAHTMSMEHAGAGMTKHHCDHGAPHKQVPCSMMGLCSTSGCMAAAGNASTEAHAVVRPVTFRLSDVLRIKGLAHAPPLEPPRA